jgi:hypothetical protein
MSQGANVSHAARNCDEAWRLLLAAALHLDAVGFDCPGLNDLLDRLHVLADGLLGVADEYGHGAGQ